MVKLLIFIVHLNSLKNIFIKLEIYKLQSEHFNLLLVI